MFTFALLVLNVLIQAALTGLVNIVFNRKPSVLLQNLQDNLIFSCLWLVKVLISSRFSQYYRQQATTSSAI